jgi:aminopeptidase N
MPAVTSDPAAPAPPIAIRREDYRPPAFLIDTVDLRFDLDPSATTVRSRLQVRRNPDAAREADLRLDGEALTLLSISLDGSKLRSNRYTREPGGGLVVHDVPDAATLEITTRIAPDRNTELSGLYVSGGSFFTQCEAEGFRRITFFPDRPDIMSRYSVTLAADRARVPVLLSNGNPGARGESGDGRHWMRWVDPHPKPSYLFALVAGDLVAVRDSFTTRSGREVQLAIWVRRGDEDRCGHAMEALKTSMAWDEERFGLEYDLDVFNIAAVSDFNMGAMENKGLNVFNTKYVLAKPTTATDGDYQGIETVVAHEYFHNWTGNRITCRDWFQLSLKEGLTVFRDQEFTADQGSAAVKRLADVRRLRAAQFPEDDGPLAHPVRPDSYIAIDNFYTATVYQKGAEVVRMMQTVIGRDGFRRGMDTYVVRHDNQAVTIEDFVASLGAGSGTDLAPFLAWYDQAGTPEVGVSDAYDAKARRYTLTLRQATRSTPGQPVKHALPIPVAMALIGPDGADLPGTAQVLMFDRAEQDFVFENVPALPVPSLLRGFSAPVKLSGLSRERLRFLAAHDSDPFVRWDSLQTYAASLMLEQIATDGPPAKPDAGLVDAFAHTLKGADADPAFAAEALSLPSEAYIADQMEEADTDAIHAVRQTLRRQLGTVLGAELRATYKRLSNTGAYATDGATIGKRALRNACLAYLGAAGEEGVRLARAQFDAQGNMTDVLAALDVLAASDGPDRAAALAAFHAKWREDDLVLDKWFAIQATSPRPETVKDVQVLVRHADFDLRNPNRVRALVGAFSAGNQVRFHDASGAGYRFLADVVIALDPLNSMTAARLVNPLGTWRRHGPARAALMRAQLQRIAGTANLSRGTYEKASKALA